VTSHEPRRVDEAALVTEAVLERWCDRVGEAGLRSTGSDAHEGVIAWIEAELATIAGLTVTSERFDVLRWLPRPEGDLERAGSLEVRTDAGATTIAIGGAVPYSRPGERTGPLVRLGPGVAITADNARGRVVLRDFPDLPLGYDYLLDNATFATPDTAELRDETYDRPGFADSILHGELLAAGHAGAAGVVFAFDLPREQIAGYFEPHKGTHYRVPAVFVGVDERERLRELAAGGRATARVAVDAEVAPATTRNVVATLAGRTDERIVVVTHTDGATWVQENGVAALLALATYFASRPIEERRRTLELAFTSAHLHISREGSEHHAAALDREYDDGSIAFVIALEHLGVDELVPLERPDGPGRHLVRTGAAEPVFWAVGPSAPLRDAVIAAVSGRDLERTLVAPGLGPPVDGQVPAVASFGGIGTHFHTHLIPTTSVITGPWSLWAPSFGREAIDIGRLRRQVLAAGDVIATLDAVPRDTIAGGYLDDRRARAAGTPNALETGPPEVAPDP
jgi:hypothetical protein